MKFCLLLSVLWICLAGSCAARPAGPPLPQLEGDWTIELTENDIGCVRTQMHVTTGSGTFEAYTRKNADKDILGGFTSLLGRVFTKNLKEGSLMRLEKGLFRNDGDTVRLAAILTSAIGSFNIEGYALHDSLVMKIRNGQTPKGMLKGYRKLNRLPIDDYPALFEKAVTLTTETIYNRAVLQTSAWTDFVREMRVVMPKLQDDLELVFAFFYHARKLPFSHYAFLKPAPETDSVPAPSGTEPVILQAMDPVTGYLKIPSFEGTVAEMDSVFSVIQQRGYRNLVVDLRGNPGGSVAAGMAFARHLTDSAFYGGIFLTQRYFNTHTTLPPVREYSQFPQFSESNFDLILKGIHNEEGLCLKVIPATKAIFKGKVYLLIDGATASTCEPIVYGLQQQKKAVAVGEKTAGAMLNGEFFDVANGFKLVVPTADYYTVDGFRIDQKGVIPTIVTKPDEALDYVKSHLLK